jgi:hypothetical protein
MKRTKPGVNKSGEPFAPRRVSTYAIPLTVLMLAGCSFADIPEPDASIRVAMEQRDRYVRACTQREATEDKRGRQIACECVFDFAQKSLNQIELEMLIANSAQDRKKQEEIRARPDYNQAAFRKKMKGLVEGASMCTSGKKG